MTQGSALDARMNEVEVKLSFAEELLETLNTTVYRQQQDIERLQRELRELREQVTTIAPAEPFSLRDDIPPHY